jgi:hypothetical protein
VHGKAGVARIAFGWQSEELDQRALAGSSQHSAVRVVGSCNLTAATQREPGTAMKFGPPMRCPYLFQVHFRYGGSASR